MTASEIAFTFVGLIALVLVYEFVRACIAEYEEYRAECHTNPDDEWLARQNIAPLSSTVDRVWNAK